MVPRGPIGNFASKPLRNRVFADRTHVEPVGEKPCAQLAKVLISRAPKYQGGDAVPGRLKLAITLALAGLIVGATPVLASNGSHGRTPMARYTGKVQNLVLHDTTAGRQSSFGIELTQQADLSKAYAMKDQDARG